MALGAYPGRVGRGTGPTTTAFGRAEFLAVYHRRSNVQSTFSAIKRKFGDFVRSKTPTAQINELLLKVLAHNITMVIHSMHELGISPSF